MFSIGKSRNFRRKFSLKIQLKIFDLEIFDLDFFISTGFSMDIFDEIFRDFSIKKRKFSNFKML